MHMNPGPSHSPLRIGVFDSGLGGISVLADLIAHFPQAHYLYYGDTANAPYGEKEVESVRRWTMDAYQYLREQGIAALVIACNTATSVAIEQIRAVADIPVLGIEPAVKLAIEANDGQPLALLATPMTIAGEKLKQLLGRFDAADVAAVQSLPCPGLARLIEENDFAGAMDYLRREIKPQLRPRPDGGYWLILGCTHYSLLYPQLRQVFGAHLRIFDGNTGLARHLARRLHIHVPEGGPSPAPLVEFCFTAAAEQKAAQAKILLAHAQVSGIARVHAANA